MKNIETPYLTLDDLALVKLILGAVNNPERIHPSAKRSIHRFTEAYKLASEQQRAEKENTKDKRKTVVLKFRLYAAERTQRTEQEKRGYDNV
jgi:hypothetical protein